MSPEYAGLSRQSSMLPGFERSGSGFSSSGFERSGSSFSPQGSRSSFSPGAGRNLNPDAAHLRPGSWGNHLEQQQQQKAAAAAAAGGVYAAGLGGDYAEALAAAHAHERRQSEGERGRAMHGDDGAHRVWQDARAESELAAAMAASLQDQGGSHAPGTAALHPAHERAAAAAAAADADAAGSEATLDASDVFRHCLSGAVAEARIVSSKYGHSKCRRPKCAPCTPLHAARMYAHLCLYVRRSDSYTCICHAYAMHALLYVCIQVRKFLRHGGHVDTVYKSAYGWDVGADYAHTRPSDGATPLNYVATWTDVIGLTDAAALVGAAPSSTGLRVGAQPSP